MNTKLRQTMTAKQTEALITKNKNQAENIGTLTATLKAAVEEARALREALDIMKREKLAGEPALHQELTSANQQVVDLTVENKSLREQLRTVSAKLNNQ